MKKIWTQTRRKQPISVNFSDFLKNKFADSLWHGSLALYLPKPDKKDASNGLILDHKVLQKCSNFFQIYFGHGWDSKIELEEGSVPTYH